MSNRTLAFATLFLLIGLGACKPTQTLVVEERNLPELTVTADREDNTNGKNTTKFERLPTNPSYLRKNDLLHTKLDVRFNWEKQHVYGKATLKFKPVFYSTDSLKLDAKGFDIHKITMLGSDKTLSYQYDDKMNLHIKLDRVYTSKEEYNIYIEYTAKPNELPVGGSDAITSDKGLYFINPLGKEAKKPKQIWTQGETESNSKWFPTIDKPNERCTQELYITVENKYKTLSNGLMVSSVANTDGTRTDYWKMDLPHAPYLFMMAIGEFAVVKDNWNGMLLEYLVEPEYEAYAKDIYPHTPEMLTFFSERFGVKYPWAKYSQVIVRDYVSGAMENTSAVIFGEFCQKTKRELIDNSDMNEGIVAHEMMHHWFGDLVTCESWSNLPLNESFANYSEYLWFEHKYGKDAADYHRMGEVTGYLAQSVMQGDNHPLIYFNYQDKEDMFDSHSYNKGGTILHMLRKYLGDAAYFEGLRVYLEDNKYTSVEIHNLRLAFEKVTGEDLNWFFNQWFFTEGHPKLTLERAYDASTKELTITVKQMQNISKSTVFILPFYIDIYMGEGQTAQRHKVLATEQEQKFVFKLDKKPLWVAIDAERDLLCERKEDQTPEEWVAQYQHGKTFLDRYSAINDLKNRQTKFADAKKILAAGLNDPFWAVRQSAIDGLTLDPKTDAAIIEKIKELAQKDARSHVRAAAIEKLAELKDKGYSTLFGGAIDKDQSYLVAGAALNALAEVNTPAALEYAVKLEKDANASMLSSIAAMYVKGKDKNKCGFFENNWKRTSAYNAYSFLDRYAELLVKLEDNKFAASKIEFFKAIAIDINNDQWTRYGAANSIKELRDHFRSEKSANDQLTQASKAIDTIKEIEKDEMLQNLYQKW